MSHVSQVKQNCGGKTCQEARWISKNCDIDWVWFKNILPRSVTNYSSLIKPHSSHLIVYSAVSGITGFLSLLLIGYGMDNNGN